MPYAALGALTAARPYELYGYLTLNQRAEACFRSKNGIEAAADYKKILANPGIDPGTLTYTLAHLGLARSYALLGDTTGSRNEYAALFGAFKDADPGLPVLRDGGAEMAALPPR